VTKGDKILSKGHDDKESATGWLAQHMKDMI